jgi:hypothetical protein
MYVSWVIQLIETFFTSCAKQASFGLALQVAEPSFLKNWPKVATAGIRRLQSIFRFGSVRARQLELKSTI